MQLYDLSLNFADILLILPFVLFSFFSFFRGFVSELLSLLLWVVTYFCSIFLHSIFIDQLPSFGINKDIFSSIVIIILFLLIFISGRILLKLISKAVQWSGFGLIDRVLGCMFGAAKGLIFVNLILFMLPTDIKNSSSLGDSVIYAQMQKFNPSIVNFAKSMISDNNSVMLDAYTIKDINF